MIFLLSKFHNYQTINYELCFIILDIILKLLTHSWFSMATSHIMELYSILMFNNELLFKTFQISDLINIIEDRQTVLSPLTIRLRSS